MKPNLFNRPPKNDDPSIVWETIAWVYEDEHEEYGRYGEKATTKGTWWTENEGHDWLLDRSRKGLPYGHVNN